MKKILRKFALPILAGMIRFLLWSLGNFVPEQEQKEIRAMLEEAKRA